MVSAVSSNLVGMLLLEAGLLLGQAPPTTPPGPRGWLLAAILLGVALSACALAAWLHRRPRNKLPANGSDSDASAAVVCPGCNKRLQVKAGLAGKKVKCAQCGEVVAIPALDTTEPAHSAGRGLGAQLAIVMVLLAVIGVAGWAYLGARRANRQEQSRGEGAAFLDQSIGIEPVAGIAETGVYATERSPTPGSMWRWTDGAARFTVPLSDVPPQALYLRLTLAVPPRQNLEIRVNGQQLFQEAVATPQWSRTFDLSGLKLGKELTLDILSDKFSPAERSKNATDQRILGVRIRNIMLISGKQSYQDVLLGAQERPGVMEQGFYEHEISQTIPCRWTNGSARLVVPIRGKAPQALALSVEAPDRPDYRLRVTVNDKLLFDDVLPSHNVWSGELPLTGVDLGGVARIELDSSTHVPMSAARGAPDNRKLGVRVRQVMLLSTPGAGR
jgi:hypothetical protein